jgi:hypothetical protein
MAVDRIMVVDRITVVDLITVAALLMQVIRAPSRSRLAIDLTTSAALATMSAARITSGGQDIGGFGTVSESGSTAITWCDDTDRAVS